MRRRRLSAALAASTIVWASPALRAQPGMRKVGWLGANAPARPDTWPPRSWRA
jgi:hypothetical protein